MHVVILLSCGDGTHSIKLQGGEGALFALLVIMPDTKTC